VVIKSYLPQNISIFLKLVILLGFYILVRGWTSLHLFNGQAVDVTAIEMINSSN